MSQRDHEEEYIVVPVIPTDTLAHSEEHPFCIDLSCPCHEDMSLIAPVNQNYQDGLLSAEEATYLVNGKTI